MPRRKTTAIGLLGSNLDAGQGAARWEKWRPSVSLCSQENLLIDRFELLYQKKFLNLASVVASDIESVSPETDVRLAEIDFGDPWDFEEVYGALHDFARAYQFKPDTQDYLIHITTG
ncbi:MAG: RNA repair transcriptional activator RtcR family protein, partial [Acidobacteriota bacterium]